MNKDALIYILIFLLCVIITASMLIFSYIKSRPSSDVVDTLLVEIPENIPIEPMVSPPIEQRRSFIEGEEQDRRTFLTRSDTERGLYDHEQQYLLLAEQLRALFSHEIEEEEEIVEEEEEEIVEEEEEEEIVEEEEEEEVEKPLTREEELEIIITAKTAQVDSMLVVINSYIRENDRLQYNITSMNDEINILSHTIITMRNTITSLENEIYNLMNPVIIEEEVIEEVPETDYRQLARIFNNMDVNRVAQILQTLPPETAINVLKTMNQRRIAQVMSALPPRVATEYSQLLLN